MNLATRLANTYGAKAPIDQDIMPDFLRDTAAAMRHDMPDMGMYSEQAKLYIRLSWIRSAFDVIGETAALQGFNVKRAQGEDLVDLENHPFERLLAKPNPLQSRFEFIRDTITFAGVNGQSYWWQNKQDENQEPAEMWILPPWRILPIPDEKMYLDGYLYDPGPGQDKIILPTWQVVHFKSFNPLNEFVGLSQIESIAMTGLTDIASQKYLYDFYGKNNARLSAILAFKDKIGDLAWEKLKNDTDQAAKTRNILMLRGVGSNVEWKRAAATSEEMQQLAQREMTRDEIYTLIAPGLASMTAVNATEANSKTGKQTFLEFSVWPKQVHLAQKITRDVLPAYGDNLVGEFDDPRQTDRVLEINETKEFAKYHTIDEVRKKRYNADPLGDDRGEMLEKEIGQIDTIEEVQASAITTDAPQEPETKSAPPTPDNNGKLKADLETWRRKSLNALKKGKGAAVTFKSDTIAPELHADVWARLTLCESASAVRDVFADAINGVNGAKRDSLVDALNRATDVLIESRNNA